MKLKPSESKTLVGQLIKPLSHEKRFETFLILGENPRNIDDLRETLRAEEQTIYGWLRRLESAGLVKCEKKVYKLTGLGRAWMGYLEGTDVIAKYRDFLNTVAMERIPSRFVGFVKSLKKCEPHPEPEPILLAHEMCKRAKEKIWIASDKAVEWSADIVLDKLRSAKGFEFLGASKFEREPVRRYELIEQGGKLRKDTKNAIYMGVLLVDDEEVGILLPADEKSLNWRLGFYSKDFEPREWAKQIFWDIWGKCEPLT